MTVKKSLDEQAEEALVMPEFDPNDTLKEVVEKFSKEINDIKAQSGGDSNATETVVKIINLLPDLVFMIIANVLISYVCPIYCVANLIYLFT